MKFRFVDRIDQCRPGSFIEGGKVLSLEEYFLLRPQGLKSEFPATLMAEALFQLGNYLIYSTYGDKLGNLVMFDSIEIFEPLKPGQRLDMRVDLISRIDNMVKMDGTGWIDGKIAIQGRGCIASLVDLHRLVNPEKFKLQFQGLHQSHFHGDKSD